MEQEAERPYLCLQCGFKSFNYPNNHECSAKWPETMEEWDKQDAKEIKNDARMKEWHKRIAEKYKLGKEK